MIVAILSITLVPALIPTFTLISTTGSISFVDHTGVQFPAQTADASIGQPHIIVQIQDGVQKVVSPTPFTSGTFVLPTWMR